MARNYAALPHEYLVEMEALNDSEFGQLIRALLKYSITGDLITLSSNGRFYANRVMAQEDRFQASYADISSARSEAGKKGASKRWSAKNGNANVPNSKNGYTETDTDTDNLLPNSSRYSVGAAVADYLTRINPAATPTCINDLTAFEQEMGSDVCIRAIDIALDNKSPNWRYIKAILSKWQSLGVRCLADIKLLDRKPDTPASNKPAVRTSAPESSAIDQRVCDTRMAIDVEKLKQLADNGDLNG